MDTLETIDLDKVKAIGGATHFNKSTPLIIVEAYGSEGIYNQYFIGDEVEGYSALDSLVRWILEHADQFVPSSVDEIVAIRDNYGEYLEVDWKDDEGTVDTETIYYKTVYTHTLVHLHDNKWIRVEKEEYLKAKFPAIYKD